MPKWTQEELVVHHVFKITHICKMYPHWTWEEALDALSQDYYDGIKAMVKK